MTAATKQHRIAYTVVEACEATSLARTRIYAAIADGSLKSFFAGRRRMISATAIVAYIGKLERDGQGRAA